MQTFTTLPHTSFNGVAISSASHRPKWNALRSSSVRVRCIQSNDFLIKRPDDEGKFGEYGGMDCSEGLMPAVKKLEAAYAYLSTDEDFTEKLNRLSKSVGKRPTKLEFSETLTKKYRNQQKEGPQIYLKRDDLVAGNSHKINSALGQALLAKMTGKTRVITESHTGNNGVAMSLACKALGLDCDIYMGMSVLKNLNKMQIMKKNGAKVHLEEGSVVTSISYCLKNWERSYEDTHYAIGSAIGPHPYPLMIRDFQSVSGIEILHQAYEMWGDKPDIVIAYVGGGSHALGVFNEFVHDPKVRLIGIEQSSPFFKKTVTTLNEGQKGLIHGAITKLLVDKDGNYLHEDSNRMLVVPGDYYPGAAPELCMLQDLKRVEFYGVSRLQAEQASQNFYKESGINLNVGSAYALAYLDFIAPTLANGTKVVLGLMTNCVCLVFLSLHDFSF